MFLPTLGEDDLEGLGPGDAAHLILALRGTGEPQLLRELLPGEVVVFASGLVIAGGRWYLYYGGADNYVGLAVYPAEWATFAPKVGGEPLLQRLQLFPRVSGRRRP